MIVCAIASERELQRVRRMIDTQRVGSCGGRVCVFGTLHGRDVCLVKTGVGRKNAAAAARAICAELRPAEVIIAGAAGALDPGLQCGETVVVESVVRENTPEKIVCPEELSRRVLSVLSAAGMQARSGRCCQANTFVHRAADKQALYLKTRAHVVDMESFAFASEFRRARVPFINIRVVSDTALHDTADMETLVRLRHRRGRFAVLLYVLRHPHECVRAWLFYRGMAIADKRIAEAIRIVLAVDVSN